MNFVWNYIQTSSAHFMVSSFAIPACFAAHSYAVLIHCVVSSSLFTMYNEYARRLWIFLCPYSACIQHSQLLLHVLCKYASLCSTMVSSVQIMQTVHISTCSPMLLLLRMYWTTRAPDLAHSYYADYAACRLCITCKLCIFDTLCILCVVVRLPSMRNAVFVAAHTHAIYIYIYYACCVTCEYCAC